MDRSRQVVQQAEAIARSIPDPSADKALAAVAEARARAGDLDGGHRPVDHQPVRAGLGAGRCGKEARPERVIWIRRGREVPPGSRLAEQARALARMAKALARAGDVDQAEAIARSITDPSVQARALAGVAEALAETGDLDRSRQVVQQAEAIARPSPTRPGRRGRWRLWRRRWPGRVIWTKLRPSPARSPTRPDRRGCWRMWRWRWPGRVMWTRPRPSPAPSPTRPRSRGAGGCGEGTGQGG